MIVPGRLATMLAALLALVLVGAVVDTRLVVPVVLLDIALVAAVLLTGRRLRRLAVDVRRDGSSRAHVGRELELVFRIANRSPRDVVVRLRQPWPIGVVPKTAGEFSEVRVAAGEVVRAALAATPHTRGAVAIPQATYEVRPATTDLARVRGVVEGTHMRVFPSLNQLSAFEALRQHHASALAGAHRHRMIGAGRDFDQLRDYVPDDDYREVNWKATARRHKPITTVYQAERSQDVLLCLDCGRMMGNPVGGGTALDHAIDAAIMLAHVANRQGDRVGLALFRDVVTRFLKPAGGMSSVNRLIEELVDARAESVFPSYSSLVGALRAHQTRRAFVFLFTDLNDPQLTANLIDVLPLATRRHAVVVVGMRDPLVDEVATGGATDRRGLYQALAARHISNERATRVRQLQRFGATVLESDAGSLSTRTINAYLAAKAKQMV